MATQEASGGEGERALDPELRLQHALDLAYRHLGRRARTEAEVRAHLAGRLVEPETVEDAVVELQRAGYLDDAGYAQRFAEDRRALDGWGAERIARKLAEVGVAREHVDAALAEDATHDEHAAAVALLRRRLRTPPRDDRERERALGLLVRRGYALELAYEAVRELERDAG